MQSFDDTICAPITASGIASVGLIRISGKDAFGLMATRFRPASKLLKSPSHRILFGLYHNKSGQALDEVLLYKFIAPHSYTGEDTVELSCHGNPRLLSRILEDLLLDCRLAEPGEFTRRAYLNGKMDLVQAEAVGDLISAAGSKALNSALSQLRGKLTHTLRELLDEITNARITIELAIDFSDQDLPQIDLDAFYISLCSLLDKAQNLADESRNARFIREGIKLCLVGAPNVGKSSLFNAFLDENRAIVSPHPGTTRDYLEECVVHKGYSLIIYDTAGLRETDQAVEQIGISLTHKLMQETDLLLVLHDPQETIQELSPLPPELETKALHLISKVDTLGYKAMPDKEMWNDFLKERGWQDHNAIPISTLLPGGLSALYDAIHARLELSEELPESPLITNSRQLAALHRAIEALSKARSAFANELGYEFIAFDLIEASSALQEIVGSFGTEDLLDKIFSGFCIGK